MQIVDLYDDRLEIQKLPRIKSGWIKINLVAESQWRLLVHNLGQKALGSLSLYYYIICCMSSDVINISKCLYQSCWFDDVQKFREVNFRCMARRVEDNKLVRYSFELACSLAKFCNRELVQDESYSYWGAFIRRRPDGSRYIYIYYETGPCLKVFQLTTCLSSTARVVRPHFRQRKNFEKKFIDCDADGSGQNHGSLLTRCCHPGRENGNVRICNPALLAQR